MYWTYYTNVYFLLFDILYIGGSKRENKIIYIYISLCVKVNLERERERRKYGINRDDLEGVRVRESPIMCISFPLNFETLFLFISAT